MKRIFALLLVLPMLLCGCSKGNNAEDFNIGSSDFTFDLSQPSLTTDSNVYFYAEIPLFSTPVTRVYSFDGSGKAYMEKIQKALGSRGENFSARFSNEATMDIITFSYSEKGVQYYIALPPDGRQNANILVNYSGSVKEAVEYMRAFLGFDIGEKTLNQLLEYPAKHKCSGIDIMDLDTGHSLRVSVEDSYTMIEATLNVT